MADVTLTCTQVFPEATTVEAFALRQYDAFDAPVAALGAAVDTADLTDGELEFTGLDANRRFVAVGTVGASVKRVAFTTLVDPE